jgi:hypothetical protein
MEPAEYAINTSGSTSGQAGWDTGVGLLDALSPVQQEGKSRQE